MKTNMGVRKGHMKNGKISAWFLFSVLCFVLKSSFLTVFSPKQLISKRNITKMPQTFPQKCTPKQKLDMLLSDNYSAK